MSGTTKHKGETLPVIRDSSPTLPRVGVAKIAEALGATEVIALGVRGNAVQTTRAGLAVYMERQRKLREK